MMPSRISRSIIALALAAVCSACATLGGAGPSTGAIRDTAEASYDDHEIQVIELNGDVLKKIDVGSRTPNFADVFGETAAARTIISPGDVLDIAIWEAPPAVLFGVSSSQAQISRRADTAASADIPQQQVGEDGRISVPFVGRVFVAGLKPEEVESLIVSRLTGRAHDPQAVVRLVDNRTRAVTVLGEVATSGRFDLSPRGERLLDALASAGGPREPIGQSTIQLARGNVQVAMPLAAVITNPQHNVMLQPNDVVTVLHQPYSFVALGAVSRNAEVPFESVGLSLAEALGRVGGLNDRRADIKGVFVFRMESDDAIDPVIRTDAKTTRDGKVPVVYSLRMSDPASLFAMQDFTMRDGDVLYISTAPGVELERFLNTLSTTAFSIVATGNALDSSN